MVAPPQQRLYFFPEPHGHGSFRPIACVQRIGSTRVRIGFPVLPEVPICCDLPAAINSTGFSWCSAPIGLGRMAGSNRRVEITIFNAKPLTVSGTAPTN
jgi:hypothetical protein